MGAGMRQVNRKLQDSVFTNLFKEPENRLRLYQALHPEDTEAGVEDIQDVTLQAVIMNGIYNDLGFTVGDRLMILIEAQSTWSTNIAIRSLIYLGETYKAYLARTGQNYYTGRRVHLPEPELYVVYTGDAAHEEESIELGEAHWGGENRYLRLSVKVLYGGGNDILSQYTEFCRIFKEMRRSCVSIEAAVHETIRECIARGILVDFLTQKEAEIMDTMTFLYDPDVIQKLHENELREEGREEGREEERANTKKERARADALELEMKRLQAEIEQLKAKMAETMAE